MTRVAVVGLGYVGLTSAACLSHLGHDVAGVDKDLSRVEALRRGEIPILEEGLTELVAEGLAAGRLSFGTSTEQAVESAEFVFLCVPTPQGADGSADLSAVIGASRQLSPHLKEGAVVVTKSTVPVGSAGAVVDALGRPDVAVVSNPEFLREGHSVSDFLHPERIVVGADDRAAAGRVVSLYSSLKAPVLITDPASAETVKYACNAFLATKVSFVNAIANLCEAVGADISDVIAGMSYDRRIGGDHLAPGPGWGGSCLPKDTKALIRMAEDHGFHFSLLEEVVAVNLAQFDRVVARVAAAAGCAEDALSGVRVAVWGITFKAGTDDLRDSPAIAVISRLLEKGARVSAYDPTQPDSSAPQLAGLELEVAGDPYDACESASALVVLTEWPQFTQLDLSKVAELMANPALVDTRRLFDPEAVTAAGLRYLGTGRS